jgi:hypothetical protein
MDSLGSLADSVLPALLARAPLTPEKVDFAWRVAVGPAIQRATSVTLNGRTLVVSTEAVWAREIERSVGEILRRLQRLLGAGAVGAVECSVKAAATNVQVRPSERT